MRYWTSSGSFLPLTIIGELISCFFKRPKLKIFSLTVIPCNHPCMSSDSRLLISPGTSKVVLPRVRLVARLYRKWSTTSQQRLGSLLYSMDPLKAAPSAFLYRCWAVVPWKPFTSRVHSIIIFVSFFLQRNWVTRTAGPPDEERFWN